MKKISWMKKFVIFTLLITLFLMSGCNASSSDIEGAIYEIGENSIKIEVFGDDPEAEYPAYEIFINEDTVIEGRKGSFGELVVGDNVEIWLENKEADEKNAKKISVFVIYS